MTINDFYKKCSELKLISWRTSEDTVKENYDFYIKLGYTHEQSLILSMCDFDDNLRLWVEWFKKAHSIQAEKLTKRPLTEILVEHIENYKIPEPVEPLLEFDECVEFESASNTTSATNQKGNNGGFFGALRSAISGLQKPPSSVNYSYSYPAPMTKKVKTANAAGYSPELLSSQACAMPEMRMSGMEAGSAAWLNNLTSESDMADTESYQAIEEKDFQQVADKPTSTFRTTCNTASMGTLLNQIRHKRAVKPSSIRIEELMNFFDYDLKGNDDLMNINVEMCDKPYSKNKLLFIGVKGKVVTPDKQNIVILLDVSGSMGSNSHSMLKTIAAVIKKLHPGDTLSLVTYSTQDHTVFEGMKFDGDVEKLIEIMFSIRISGCTNGSKGIETAYKIAADNFIEGGANKVILITDGDLNFGINSNDGLKNLILEKKKTGVFLSVVGMGIGNYKDDKLETLAKNGNGNYCVINSSSEVEDMIVKKYEQLIFTIAKDVKAQVEFNPALIKSYRLLGYENREISHSDFNNDQVIAEPFGSGATCVALYEIELADGDVENAGLKYQKPVLTDSKEYCTVSVRYKLPMADTSELISKPLDHIGEMTTNLKLAYICYAIAEKFRESDKADLKDELFARYLAETMKDDEIEKLNGDKIELLKFLAK